MDAPMISWVSRSTSLPIVPSAVSACSAVNIVLSAQPQCQQWDEHLLGREAAVTADQQHRLEALGRVVVEVPVLVRQEDEVADPLQRLGGRRCRAEEPARDGL